MPTHGSGTPTTHRSIPIVVGGFGHDAPDGPTQINDVANAADTIGIGVFGDGSDGAITFDGTTARLGITPSASTYTLTRDIYLAGPSVINTGVTIKTAGFRIFCTGTLTNSGTISNDGSAPSAGATGMPNANGLAGTLVSAGAGATSTATGTPGQPTNPGSGNYCGGNGGAGGLGALGTQSFSFSGSGLARSLVPILANSIPGVAGTALTYGPIAGGAGGGAGGGDGTNAGGGGGSGGGAILICAQSLAGTGTISAIGGAGRTNSTGNVGGGGGGGGGFIALVYGTKPGTQTTVVTGGAGGALHGTGAAGAAGGAGVVVQLQA